MNMFGTEGVVENGGSKFIKPGINDVKIVSFEAVENTNPTLRINFEHLTNKFTENGNTVPQALSIDLGFTEKSATYQNRKIKHLAKALVDEATVDATIGKVSSIQDYAAKLNALIGGKPVRIKFSGKEVAGKEGKSNWFKAELGLPAFAESVAVPLSNTTLKYDVNNKYDMQLLAPKTTMDTAVVGAGTADLPF